MKLENYQIHGVFQHSIVPKKEIKKLMAYCETAKPLNLNLSYKGELFFCCHDGSYFYLSFGISADEKTLQIYEQTVSYNSIDLWSTKVVPYILSRDKKWYLESNILNNIMNKANISQESDSSSDYEYKHRSSLSNSNESVSSDDINNIQIILDSSSEDDKSNVHIRRKTI